MNIVDERIDYVCNDCEMIFTYTEMVQHLDRFPTHLVQTLDADAETA